ncbi:NADP-dependent 3-hydroxy acid dehydrogenase YdfG [Kosakonia arachidis]|uniref:NADP-dependent 3-hydroxy acid dehydrogenase YdfG n=1 Tax=Kosakonia arachidis TaxID=551989 RepID=A0A1I6Z7K8_9ENTR|nr:SDR family NAD(P)-dependent oxidoreductase [Kosakonia arachidis]SFT58677.1 NADP-dependent 3-hydroxy acid dehydrogenase YdfG [Kosakonia arachidis]
MTHNARNSQQVVLVTGAGSGIGRAVSLSLARAGHQVYASMREIRQKNRERAEALLELARAEGLSLDIVELDVLSEVCCQAAVNQILARHGRVDVVVNNAGMLMTGITEAFSIEQVARIIDTNALSWLRVNRAVLPAMRRQGGGLLMYVGSTTARLHEPFLGPYIASKVAGDAIAEIMAMELRPVGIESVILVPGAFTSGTEHFAHSNAPEYFAIEQQYGDLPDRISGLADQLSAIDAANGGALDVSAVGQAAVDVLAIPRGQRPFRVVIDGQRKGTDAIDAIYHEKQAAFLRQMGLEDLILPAPSSAV